MVNSDDVVLAQRPMEKKKLSTAEILAKARAEKAAAAAAAAGGETAPAEPAAAAESAPVAASPVAEAPAPAAPSKPAGGAGAPKSTKDILAAARAQSAAKAAGGGAAAPATPAAAAEKPGAPKPAGAPKSTKDILAAARAQKAGGAAATATADSAVAKPAKGAPAVAAAPAADLSVQEMMKAVREGKPAEVDAPAAKAPIVPKIPVKPAPVAKGAKKGDAGSRRNFVLAFLFAPFAMAWALLSATGLVALLGAARFMFPNVVVEPPSKFKVGPTGDYPPGTVSNKWKALYGIWIVNAEYQGKSLIYALSTVCTHLGCTPNWLDGEQKFKCPCHGSGFYITGINFEGPAPRPLERFAIRTADDGSLEVDKSQKFQQEMGQWDDTKSFVEVA